jgi:hypothetical protein
MRESACARVGRRARDGGGGGAAGGAPRGSREHRALYVRCGPGAMPRAGGDSGAERAARVHAPPGRHGAA